MQGPDKAMSSSVGKEYVGRPGLAGAFETLLSLSRPAPGRNVDAISVPAWNLVLLLLTV